MPARCVEFDGTWVGADVQRPAVDDAGKVALVFDVRVDQLVQLPGLLRIQRVSTVDFRQRR